MKGDVMIFEVKEDGNVLSTYQSQAKAKGEMRRLRKQGILARVYSRWVRPSFLKKKKAEPKKDFEPWFVPENMKVAPYAAYDIPSYWRTINEPYFIGAYCNGEPCNPEFRDSDLSVQPTGDGLDLCYRDLKEKRMYFVLKDISDISVAYEGLRITGRMPDNSLQTYVFPVDKSKRRKKEEPPPFPTGWYVIGNTLLAYLCPSERELEDVYRAYDRYVEYTAVYSTFGGYAVEDGYVQYRDGTPIGRLIEDVFQTKEFRPLEIEDPAGLRTAFRTKSRKYLSSMVGRYPELGIVLSGNDF